MAILPPRRPLSGWPEGAAAVRALKLDPFDLLADGIGLEYRADGSVWLSYYLNSDRDPQTGDAIEHRDLVPDVRWNANDAARHRADVTAEFGFYPPDRDHMQMQGGGRIEVTGATFGGEDPDDELGYRVKWDGVGEEPARPTDLRGTPYVHWFMPKHPTRAHVGDRWTPTEVRS